MIAIGNQNSELMKIIQAKNYRRIPWNNGAGITYDIALSAPDEPFWRLSLAEMPTDAPFSLFPNLSRILTVVQGVGLKLLSNETTYAAPFETPVAFSGDVSLVGQLKDGPVQNYNLVFDETQFQATVIVGDASTISLENAYITAVYLLAGHAKLNRETANAGDTLLGRNDLSPVEFSDNARAVFISLQQTIASRGWP